MAEKLAEDVIKSTLGTSVRLHRSVFGGLNSMTNSILSNFGTEKCPENGTNVDKQRLNERLKKCGFIVKNIKGDGNCQFASLSFQLYGDPHLHRHIRQQVCKQLAQNSALYDCFVCYDNRIPNYDEYCKKMTCLNEWGDNITLQAAADVFQIKILLITSFVDQPLIEITPSDSSIFPKRIVIMSFYSEVHYNAVQSVESVVLLKCQQ